MRRFLIAGAAVALVVTGLVAGSPAQAGVGPSQDCRNGGIPGASNYREILDTGAHVSVLHGSPNADDFSVNLCFSDRPWGTGSLLVGGIVHMRVSKAGPETYDVYLDCAGDTTLIGTPTFCDGTVSSTLTLHKTPTGAGPVPTGGRTQLYVYVDAGGTLVLTNGANTGETTATTTGNPTVTSTDTCVTVAGTTPPTGTSCTSRAFDAFVAAGDGPNTTTGGSTATCLVSVGTNCMQYAPRAYVEAFDDTGNDTLIDIIGVPVLDDRGRVCAGSGCPTT